MKRCWRHTSKSHGGLYIPHPQAPKMHFSEPTSDYRSASRFCCLVSVCFCSKKKKVYLVVLLVMMKSEIFIYAVYTICVFFLLYVRYRAYEEWRQSFSNDRVIIERWFDRFDNFWLGVNKFDRFCSVLPTRLRFYSPIVFGTLWNGLANRVRWTEVHFHRGGVIMVTIAEGIARVFTRPKSSGVTEEVPLLSVQDPQA